MPDNQERFNQLDLPKERDDAPGPLRRRERAEGVSIDELYDAIMQLTDAVIRLNDHLTMETWGRSYGGGYYNRQSDPQRMRPITPLGQEPFDPDRGS